MICFHGTPIAANKFKKDQHWTILSQLNPVNTLTIYLSNIHFNIILSCIPEYFKWPLPLKIFN
jgi:hypothetical protein